MKLGVLGGSFNPPHPGHIRAAQGAADYLGLKRVLMIPAAQPPHKTLSPGAPSQEDRLEMCRIAAAGCSVIRVSDLELARGGKSYTADTLAQLRAENPEDELYLIMGMDMFLTLDSWYCPEKICSLAHIAVACREKKDFARKEKCSAMISRLESDYKAKVIQIPLDFIEISSTTSRRLIAFGCGEECLHKGVWDYIQSKSLYGVNKPRKGLSLEQLREEAFSLLDHKRKPHVMGCESVAAKLAHRWGVDEEAARRAAILHDVTKALKTPEQLILMKKYGIMADEAETEYKSTFHAHTGAEVAKWVFGEDETVCSAIRWHTTGRPGMTMLEKIIYIADYIEPTRSFSGVEQFRDLAYNDIDRCLTLALKNTADHLRSSGKPVAPVGLQAYEYMLTQQERKA